MPAEEDGAEGSEESEAETAAGEPAQPSKASESGTDANGDSDDEKEDGSTLVLLNLDTGDETRYDLVADYEFAEEAAVLAFTTSTKDGSGDGAYVVPLDDVTRHALLEGDGRYEQLALSKDGEQVAFLTDRDDSAADQSEFSLYRAGAPGWQAEPLATSRTDGVPDGWWISEHGDVRFSYGGSLLHFGTAPRPEPEAADETIVMEGKSLRLHGKAKEADRWLLTREDFREFPDLWVTDGGITDMQQVSDANPQQKDYLWGSAELVEWTSNDGVELQGMLFKPDGFDPAREYPMLVYFLRADVGRRPHLADSPAGEFIRLHPLLRQPGLRPVHPRHPLRDRLPRRERLGRGSARGAQPARRGLRGQGSDRRPGPFVGRLPDRLRRGRAVVSGHRAVRRPTPAAEAGLAAQLQRRGPRPAPRGQPQDWAVRMQQFFDHYLQDAPAPVWMEKGVPAVDKGRTLGTRLLRPDSP